MSGIVYLMKRKENEQHIRIGYKTMDTVDEVANAVNNEYEGFECIALYDLCTNDNEKIESLVKEIRFITKLIAGKLIKAKPEYYDASSNESDPKVAADFIELLKTIAMLRGDIENFTDKSGRGSAR